MIENEEYKQAYERYKYTVKLLENKFVLNEKIDNLETKPKQDNNLEINRNENNI